MTRYTALVTVEAESWDDTLRFLSYLSDEYREQRIGFSMLGPIQSPVLQYRIRNVEEREEALFWSNADGWVPERDSDLFTGVAALTLTLPFGGAWVPA